MCGLGLTCFVRDGCIHVKSKIHLSRMCNPIQPSFDTKKKHMLWCRLWHPCDVGDILGRLQQTGWVGDGLWLLAEGTRSLVCFFSWCTVSCQQRPLLWDETRYLRALFASSLHPHDLSVLIWVQLCDRYKTCTEVLTNTFIPTICWHVYLFHFFQKP